MSIHDTQNIEGWKKMLETRTVNTQKCEHPSYDTIVLTDAIWWLTHICPNLVLHVIIFKRYLV